MITVSTQQKEPQLETTSRIAKCIFTKFFVAHKYLLMFQTFKENANECPQGTLLRIHFKKVFMGKEKKAINVLTAFFISHKSDVKTFLKWILKEYPKGTRQHDPTFKYL